MKLLLDTHVAIWVLVASRRLPAAVRNLVLAADEAYVSAATVWEIAIKFAIGRADAPPFSGKDAVRYFDDAGYQLLPITAAHAAAIEALPMLHRDPFDRLLVAQAIHEGMQLVTSDAQVARYSPTFVTW